MTAERAVHVVAKLPDGREVDWTTTEGGQHIPDSPKPRQMSERAAFFGRPGMTITDAAKEACEIATERDSTVYLVFNERLIRVWPEAVWPEVVHAYWAACNG